MWILRLEDQDGKGLSEGGAVFTVSTPKRKVVGRLRGLQCQVVGGDDNLGQS